MIEEGLLVEHVMAASIAAELEIEAGDRLLLINGSVVRDIIDYNFHSCDDELLFLIKKVNGDLWELEFDRPDEGIGISFAAPVPAACGNNCIFCFVHQLPKGLRKPLYVKDEDFRFSFLYGNYVTLSNILPEELERVKEQRLSPIYISVHSTDNALRERLLGRRKLVPVLETLHKLADAGIVMHTQIVLCPGINDGAALEKTVNDLAALYPIIASLAIVPLGLTRHRKGLEVLAPVTGAYAAGFVNEWLPKQYVLEKRLKGDFLHLADEFFIKGRLSFPPVERYGDFSQLENGVGMIPLFMEESGAVLAAAESLELPSLTVVTGLSPYQFILDFVEKLAVKTSVSIRLVPISNRFFGDEVTVTGLVTGSDIVAGLNGLNKGSILLVPDVMIKEGEGLFLDEMNLDDIAAALRCEVHLFQSSPEGLYLKLLELADNISTKN